MSHPDDEPRRAAGVYGTVKDAAGFPLQNVIVTINGHPELGETITRADGVFDIVVNGGSQLTVSLKKDGYLDVQRTKHVPWSARVQVDRVAMLKPDPTVTPIDLAATTEPLQVARGSIIGDEDGIRQGTLLLPAGTEATMRLPGGSSASDANECSYHGVHRRSEWPGLHARSAPADQPVYVRL